MRFSSPWMPGVERTYIHMEGSARLPRVLLGDGAGGHACCSVDFGKFSMIRCESSSLMKERISGRRACGGCRVDGEFQPEAQTKGFAGWSFNALILVVSQLKGGLLFS